MTATETVRLIAEVLGIIGIAGGGFFWLIRLAYRLLNRVETLHEKVTLNSSKIEELSAYQKDQNGAVARHVQSDEQRFNAIEVQLAHVEGSLSSIHQLLQRGDRNAPTSP